MKHKLLLIFFTALILLAPAVSAVEMVENGDFSSGLYAWDTYTSGANSEQSGSVSSNAEFETIIFNTYTQAYAGIYQDVDLTGVDTLTFTLQKLGGSLGEFIVYIDRNSVASYSASSIPTTPTSYSIDVSGYSGVVDIEFYQTTSSVTTTGYLETQLDDVSAVFNPTAPTMTTYTLSSGIVSVGEAVTATIAYTPGNPTNTDVYIYWGDGATTSYLGDPYVAESTTHTYSQTGIYTITAVVSNGYVDIRGETTVEVISLDFSATPTQGEPPLSVGFQLSAVGFNSFSWNFGDGGTSTELNPYHTYQQTGSYTVTLTGTTASGKTYQKTKTDYISLAPQSISWSSNRYTSGDTATISWQLRDPDYTNYQYTLHIYQSDSFGNALGDSIVTSTLSGTSDTYTWDTTGSVGYYTAAVIRTGGSAPATLMSATTQVVGTATLTVNLATSGVTYTEPTTVTVSQSGTIIDTQTTSTGQATFTIPTGTYQVSATTQGYATQTASVQLIESTAITIDFVTGTSQSGSQGGSGSSYASTFVTFRVQDSGTGKYVQGARIIAVGVMPTNPVEWMANLFGAAWGQNIIDTELEGFSDMNGIVTFAMFPNVRYSLTITYDDITETRSFQPSTLTGEYLISIPITETNKEPATSAVIVSVETDENDSIILHYADSTQTTQQITASLYQIVDGERVLIDSEQANIQDVTLTFSPASPSGNDYIISVTAITESYGTIEREYGVSFPGPMVKIGNLPNEAYIVICFFVLLTLGAIGTFVTSRMYALVIVFAAFLMWWFGWMFALGPVGGIALIICFILAIAYYMATGGQPQ